MVRPVPLWTLYVVCVSTKKTKNNSSPTPDPGSNNSANYQLSAVLTHQGRSSSSGHYLAWVRYRNDEWIKLDDDKVSVVTEEDILKLSGGGMCVCVC